MDSKIALVDVLDDPPYNITEIFRSVLTSRGLSKETLIRIDGLTPQLVLPQDVNIIGFIISGSIHHIYEKKGTEEWKNNLCEFVRRFYARIPILGVCFGHQVLAYALGGKIGPSDRGKEIGTIPIYVTEVAKNDLLFGQFKNGSLVPLSHLDHVLTPPKGTTILAYNAHSPNQAFKVGKSWGIQFHPELTPQLFKHLLGGRIKNLKAQDASDEANALQKIADSIKDCPEAIDVLERFVLHCLDN